MPKNWTGAGLAVLIDALAVTAVTAVLALAYWLVTGANGEYQTIVSNVLFIEGGVILTFGALLSFFKIGGTTEIRRLILSSALPFERRGFTPAACEDNDEEQDAGWLLIFLGATLIVFSILTSFNHLI
jgi:hypothetical protein